LCQSNSEAAVVAFASVLSEIATPQSTASPAPATRVPSALLDQRLLRVISELRAWDRERAVVQCDGLDSLKL
jgi:hypothetical protein